MFQKIYEGDTPVGWCWLSVAAFVLGCASAQATRRHDALRSDLADAGRIADDAAPAPADASSANRLERAELIREVLKRNPSIESARQAWRAALSRYSQERALEDPMLEYAFAPLSIASSSVRYGQTITLSQKFPWPGKLELAGEIALAEAEAARDDYQSARLELALMASLLFDEYYAVARSLELNAQHRVLVEDIQRAAEAQYETGRGSQQDPIQAEIELAYVDRQKIMLDTRRAVIVAQMNGLMHRRPQAPLPAPPEELDLPAFEEASSERLQEQALANRPELKARRSELRAREVARELADRQSYPDFGVMASYSSMWEMPEHQWMLGFSVNLPIQLGRRKAAVEASEARITEVETKLLGQSDEIRVQVEESRQRVLEAAEVVRLYRERLMPAARAQIEAARASYVTGNGMFQSLIEAERSLRNVELEYQEALATLGQNRAQLLRTLGRIPGLPAEGEAP
jgi:outer membrane protein, heavy metal efflux system